MPHSIVVMSHVFLFSRVILNLLTSSRLDRYVFPQDLLNFIFIHIHIYTKRGNVIYKFDIFIILQITDISILKIDSCFEFIDNIFPAGERSILFNKFVSEEKKNMYQEKLVISQIYI